MRALARPRLAGLALSAALLTGILGYMVIDRVQLLRSGREIVLPIRPVDPRDLFKGDYARLGYDISTVPLVAGTGDLAYGTRVFVTLEQDAAGVWKPIATAQAMPAKLAANQIALSAQIRGNRTEAGTRRQFVAYGLERYFVPEGTGGRIEDMARKSTLSAIVAVDSKGRAAIKGLVIDGKTVYEEPLL